MIGRKVKMTVVELGNKLREMSEIKNAKRTRVKNKVDFWAHLYKGS